MLGDRAPGAAPGLPRRRKAAHAGPSLLGLARVRTRVASTAQLWLAPPLTLNTQNSRQHPPPRPRAWHPHRTAPRGRPPPAFRHRETLVPQTSVGAARRPRPLLLPGWGGAGATTPRAGPRSAGLEPEGGRGLQTDQSLRPAPSGRPRASRKGRRGCFKAPGGKPENRAGRQGQGWPSAAWTAREQEEFTGQAHPLGAEARSRQRAETPRGELGRSPWPETKARGRSPSWSLAGPPHFGIRPLAAV